MADLREYLVNDRAQVNAKTKEFVLSVYNVNTASVNNGGQCCCWTVPAGTTWAIFELWGAGGSGGGACCCMGHYWGPFTGTYAKKYLQVTPGCYFCICAAGSGCCTQQCCGTCGFPSWVNCGSNGTQVTCAAGGCGGCVLCFRSYQGCTGICWGSCNQGCFSNAYDITMTSLNSPNKVSNYCWQNMFEFSQGVPKFANTRLGLDHCVTSLTIQGCAPHGGSRWPAGGGNSATACGGGCCWGAFGAGGLVMITYG